MEVHFNVTLIGKVIKPWKDDTGQEHKSFLGNISQKNGEIIDRIRLTQSQYDALVAGKQYAITADYGTGRNGGYLRIVNIEEAK